jgi:hypothetical protein
MSESTTGNRSTYSASCHCGAVRFSFRAEPITRGVRCNCSICRRKGAVMSVPYVPPQDFLTLEGLDSLAVYRFGDEECNHYFCKRCGVYPFHDGVDTPGHYRINLGCVEGLESWNLPVDLIDGRSW